MTEQDVEIHSTDSPVAPGSEVRFDSTAHYRYLETFNITVNGIGVFQRDMYPQEVDDSYYGEWW